MAISINVPVGKRSEREQLFKANRASLRPRGKESLNAFKLILPFRTGKQSDLDAFFLCPVTGIPYFDIHSLTRDCDD